MAWARRCPYGGKARHGCRMPAFGRWDFCRLWDLLGLPGSAEASARLSGFVGLVGSAGSVPGLIIYSTSPSGGYFVFFQRLVN